MLLIVIFEYVVYFIFKVTCLIIYVNVHVHCSIAVMNFQT